MLKHQYSIEFKKAADKEYHALLQKGTFEYVEKSKIDSKAQVLPLCGFSHINSTRMAIS